jgi:hypothetical protein
MCLDEANGGPAIPRNDSATGLYPLEVAAQTWLIVSKHPTAIDSSHNYVGHCSLRKERLYLYLIAMMQSRVQILVGRQELFRGFSFQELSHEHFHRDLSNLLITNCPTIRRLSELLTELLNRPQINK